MQKAKYLEWLKKRDKGFKNDLDFLYLCQMGLIEEAGEVAGKLKRVFRKDDPQPSIQDILVELGDAYWYFNALAIYSRNNYGLNSDWPLYLSFEEPELKSKVVDWSSCKDLLIDFSAFACEFSSKCGTGKVTVSDFIEGEKKFTHLAGLLGSNLNDVRAANIDKLNRRVSEGTIRGTGDDR